MILFRESQGCILGFSGVHTDQCIFKAINIAAGTDYAFLTFGRSAFKGHAVKFSFEIKVYDIAFLALSFFDSDLIGFGINHQFLLFDDTIFRNFHLVVRNFKILIFPENHVIVHVHGDNIILLCHFGNRFGGILIFFASGNGKYTGNH